MTKPKTVTSRGDRRPAVRVERDRLVAAEKKMAGVPDSVIAAELGLAPSSVRRLASQGLREAMESGDQPSVKALFTLVVTSFTEVLEDLDETIAAYKAANKPIPTRVLATKINAGLAIARTCGFDTKTLVVEEKKLQRPVINIIMKDSGGEYEKLADNDPRRADMSNNEGRFVWVQKRLPPAPVADAEVVEPQ